MVNPAAYVLMLGVLVQLLFGWSLAVSVSAAQLFRWSFCSTGGFARCVDEYPAVWADVSGIRPNPALCPSSLRRIGFPHATDACGPSGPVRRTFRILYIGMVFHRAVDSGGSFLSPTVLCCPRRRVAQRGILWSIFFWRFSISHHHGGALQQGGAAGSAAAVFAYPMLAEKVLPPAAKGLFYIGLFATIMSTLSSYTFTAAMTIGNDMVGRIRPDEKSITRWTRIGLAVTLALAIALALWLDSVVAIWYTIGTTVIPGLLLPLLAGYYKPFAFPAKYGFLVMLTGWLTSTIWLVAGLLNGGHYWLEIEPMYPGLLATLALILLFKNNRLGRRK
jgi:SSS family solute:Na+ symporter